MLQLTRQFLKVYRPSFLLGTQMLPYLMFIPFLWCLWKARNIARNNFNRQPQSPQVWHAAQTILQESKMEEIQNHSYALHSLPSRLLHLTTPRRDALSQILMESVSLLMRLGRNKLTTRMPRRVSELPFYHSHCSENQFRSHLTTGYICSLG